MNIYTESQIKAFFKCSNFYHLGGSVYQYHPSQLLFFQTLKDFYLCILKSEIEEFDKDLIRILKKNINLHYPEINSIDDFQYLLNWTLSLLNDFFQTFPFHKYTPLFVPHTPVLNYADINISLNFDLLLVQNNKMAFMHAICFLPKNDTHHSNNDFFNFIKLKYLNSTYNERRYSVPPVKLHNVSLEPASFRNRSNRNYSLSKVTFDSMHHNDILNTKIALNYFVKNKETPLIKPYCDIYDCPKRKECKYA